MRDPEQDLSRYYGVQDARKFASYVLDRDVRLEDLTEKQAQEIRTEARLAHRPYEEQEIEMQNTRIDTLSNAEMIAEAAAWLL